MNFNPYAAPQAQPIVPGMTPGTPGEPQAWDVGEVFRSAWEIFKPNWGPLVAAIFASSFLGALPQQIPAMLQLSGTIEPDSTSLRVLTVVSGIVGWLIREFFAAGFTRACLGTVRTGTAKFGDVFGVGRSYLPYLLASFLTTLAILVGFAALIVPGIILALGLWMTGFFLLDQGLDPMAAIRASWEASKGQKGAFFALALAELGVLVLGVMACCVGFLAASMVALIARTIVYLRVAGLAQGTLADANRHPS